VDLLSLVQSLHYEATLPGSPPAATAGQSGRAADLVRWAIEAYHDIQRDKDGKWKWLRREWQIDTVADDPSYTYDEFTDVLASAAIDRFRAWDLQREEPPLIYLVSDGIETQSELVIADWREFRRLYGVGTHTAAAPWCVAADHNDELHFGPKPNGVYRVNGHYWRSNQTLADDDDVPEMPADYHMLIVYRALVKYAYNVISQEKLARARAEGEALYDALCLNQWYGRMTLRWPDALA